MKSWNDKEVKALFCAVENCKANGTSLKGAFSAHAKSFKRKPNSVRNYYYHEVDNLVSDAERTKRLNIDLSKHSKTHFKGFDKTQEGELFEKIEKMTSDGASVRSACLKLSGGDLSLMTRLQNKYQNMKRKLDKKDNIIPFKQKILTENDINSLFLGLVKLIKKTALEEARNNAGTNELLKKAFKDLAQKEDEIVKLKHEIERLKVENRALSAKNGKQEALKKHLSSSKLDADRLKRI